MYRKYTRRADIKRERKRKIRLIIIAVLVVALIGTAVYFLTAGKRAEMAAEATEKRVAEYEKKLLENIEYAAEICPEVLEFTGESETSYIYFTENINSSDNIYDKASNANSLIKTAAFALDLYMAVDIEGVENGKNVDVHYDNITTDYNEKLNILRNDFINNWFGYMGIS